MQSKSQWPNREMFGDTVIDGSHIRAKDSCLFRKVAKEFASVANPLQCIIVGTYLHGTVYMPRPRAAYGTRIGSMVRTAVGEAAIDSSHEILPLQEGSHMGLHIRIRLTYHLVWLVEMRRRVGARARTRLIDSAQKL